MRRKARDKGCQDLLNAVLTPHLVNREYRRVLLATPIHHPLCFNTIFFPIHCQVHDVALSSWLLPSWLLEPSALQSGEKNGQFSWSKDGSGLPSYHLLMLCEESGNCFLSIWLAQHWGSRMEIIQKGNMYVWILLIVRIILLRGFFLYLLHYQTKNNHCFVPGKRPDFLWYIEWGLPLPKWALILLWK